MPNYSHRTRPKLETLLLQAAIFLIPSNMAYRLYHDGAYISGRLSDYLLPKLYLSDLPILALIGIFIYKSLNKLELTAKNKKIWWIALAYLGLNLSIAPDGYSSMWMGLKIVEFMLLGVYLTNNYDLKNFIATIKSPLIASVLFQFGLAIYQYINQKSFLGYYLLGEPDLSAVGIARISTTNGLEVIPYGTTPHPNILAGFIVISALILIIGSHLHLKANAKRAAQIALIGLSMHIIWLTKSLAALSGIILALTSTTLTNIASIRISGLIVQATAIIALSISLLVYPILQHQKFFSHNPSFYERYEIKKVANDMIRSHPLTGVGVNQFTRMMPSYPISNQQTYLLQPPHHGLILILAETGILGLLVIILLTNRWIHTTQAARAPITVFLPLIALAIILLLDHYPLTLQTGQLMLTLSLALPLLKTQT